MSLMGIDAGTTACKVAVFNDRGESIVSFSSEHDIVRPGPGLAELSPQDIWESVQQLIRRAADAARDTLRSDPVRSIAVSSLGEATVPVTRERRILGHSILNSDTRGAQYLPSFSRQLEPGHVYNINGNVPGNHYSLTKLLWIREHCPDIYRDTFKFLHWGPFISFMLGAEPVVDYSLANRTLLFDLNAGDWSDEVLSRTGLDRDKLPATAPSGVPIGTVADHIARELNLPSGVVIATGAHDQCANALGCGVICEGSAMYGMGTVTCITPVFSERKEASLMMPRGLNTEHHAVPGCFVSFIYNQGGCLVKWFRDTFAAGEHEQAQRRGEDVYVRLFGEIPDEPSGVLVLPHFDPTGPPAFISDSSGVMIGLKLTTTRGEILKGILEGSTYYLKECVDSLPETGIRIDDYRAVGGGSRSDAWVQMCADIFARPFTRPQVTEAGVLGAAMLGAIGDNAFASAQQAVDTMVRNERVFEPDMKQHERYMRNYDRFQPIWPLMRTYLAG